MVQALVERRWNGAGTAVERAHSPNFGPGIARKRRGSTSRAEARSKVERIRAWEHSASENKHPPARRCDKFIRAEEIPGEKRFLGGKRFGENRAKNEEGGGYAKGRA
ncbi:hypothetical protein KM043_003836 [Ampulex compressa]|nr:hypothetical protein KM043_003836 [Ampulex compressa]